MMRWLKSTSLVVLFVCLVVHQSEAQFSSSEAFSNAAKDQVNTASRFAVPPGHEPGFRLSIAYPTSVAAEFYPWVFIDFRNEPEAYMRAVLAYILEGNTAVDWDVGKNAVRKWYHAPWMHFGRRGREPVHGLTLERQSKPRELHELQVGQPNNWAVGFYNPAGGYTLGQVWSNPAKPATNSVVFPVGTVSAKLLFTDAKIEQVPYLAGSKEWFAQIHRNREPVTMRLLQLDFAVRDQSADSTTGWVFGTFMYHTQEEGSDVWQKLIPVGVHWGNDTERTENDFSQSKPLTDGWVNPKVMAMFGTLPRKWLGLWGRVNGPVDNPRSACLACHARSMDMGESLQQRPFAPLTNDVGEVRNFFKNRKPTEPFFSGFRSLDYSLQLSDGIFNFRTWVRNVHQDHVDNIYATPDAERQTVITTFSDANLEESVRKTQDMLDNEYESPFSRE